MELLSQLCAGESPDSSCSTQQQQEAFERLWYLAESGASGLLLGLEGTGKTGLFRRLADALRRGGRSVVEINLRGVTGDSLPLLLASRLGLGLSEETAPGRVWSALQDHASGCRLTGCRQVILLDDVDRAAEEMAPPLDRLIELLEGTACLCSARPHLPERLSDVLLDRCRLRIELSRLEAPEIARLTSRFMDRQARSMRLDAEACRAMAEITAGRLDRIQTLSELVCLAAEAEDRSRIDQDLVRSVADELRLGP